jgi:F0F1-type ATP synthase membrane subunit b/b'
MNTFGTIKTKIQKASIGLYGKPEFKSFLKQFKSMVLENKDIAELYYIYDDLSSNKGINESIAEDYINETVEYSQILVEGNSKHITKVSNWIDSIVLEHTNEYKDIDNTIYKKSIKDLSTVLESKRKIKSNIILEEKKEDIIESVNLPISTMVKVAEENIKLELKNISESERKVIEELSSMSDEEIKTEMDQLKENVISNLKSTLNESTESDLKSTIENTIKKINESPYDRFNLYKLRGLSQGL